MASDCDLGSCEFPTAILMGSEGQPQPTVAGKLLNLVFVTSPHPTPHLLGPGAQTVFLPWFPSRPPVSVELKLYSPPQTARMHLYIPTQGWAYAVSGLSSHQAGYASTSSWEDRCLVQVYMCGRTQPWTRLSDASHWSFAEISLWTVSCLQALVTTSLGYR